MPQLRHCLTDKSCDWSETTDNLLTKCSAQYIEATHEYPIIYGDYFFIKALEISRMCLFSDESKPYA